MRQTDGAPIGFFLLGGRLLSFGRWDLALDIESDAVGARHTETSGITAHLRNASEGCSRMGIGCLVGADLSRMACLLSTVSLVSSKHSRLGLTSQALEARCLQ